MAFKGDEFVRKIYRILRSAGLTGIEIARFFVKNGLTLSKNVITPIHHSVQKSTEEELLNEEIDP